MRPTKYERNWGTETIIAWTPTHAGKILERKKGTKGGFQLHVKEETHYLYSGSLWLRTLDYNKGEIVVRTVEAGESWTVPPMTPHQEEALADSIIIEISDPTEDDRISLEPDPGGLPTMTAEEAAQKATTLALAFTKRAEGYRAVAKSLRRYGFTTSYTSK